MKVVSIGTKLANEHAALTDLEKAEKLTLTEEEVMEDARAIVEGICEDFAEYDFNHAESIVMMENVYRTFVAAKAIVARMLKEKQH